MAIPEDQKIALDAISQQIEKLVQGQPSHVNAAMLGGALFGAGVEIMLRVGATSEQIHTTLDALIAEMRRQGIGVEESRPS